MRISDWSSDVCSSDLVADAQPRLDRFRKGEGRFELAGALGADADDLAVVDVEATLADEVVVDHRVEVRVVHDVVHMAVDVVVHPARRDGEEVRKARSEEHTSELPSLMRISYAVFRL